MADGVYKCHDCHMNFGTINLLQKHKAKFCVGSVGDPESLRLRKGLRSSFDSESPRPISPDERPIPDDGVVDRKVQQLKALKTNREKLRDIRNFEERMLLDKLKDMEAKNGYKSPVRQSRSQFPLSSDKAVQDLELEYELLRYKENRDPPLLVVPSPQPEDHMMTSHSLFDTSMSNHLPQDDYQRYNPNQDAQLRQLAENHGRQMEYLQLKNRDLEKQKEDIRRRLLELGTKGRPTGDNTSELLAELRAQEDRNAKALEDLKRHLYDINHQRVNVIKIDALTENIEYTEELLQALEQRMYVDPNLQHLRPPENKQEASSRVTTPDKANTSGVNVTNTEAMNKTHKEGEIDDKNRSISQSSSIDSEKQEMAQEQNVGTQDNDTLLRNKLRGLIERIKNSKPLIGEYERQALPQPAPPPPVETGRKSYVYPVYYGNSLVAEISAIRQAYLQNGGNDPDVLAQMAQMQAEAQNIEDSMKKGGYDNRHREKKGANQLQQLMLENDRLHRELLLIQEQNSLARDRRKSDREDELERQLRRLHEEQLRKLLELQNEIAALRNRSLMEQYKPPEPQTARLPPPAPNNADTPWLLQRPYVEVEKMVPYDQYAGFIIFYDFVLNLDPQVTACRLISGLHSSSSAMGEPTLLPTVYTEPATRATYMQNTSNAVIGARQPVPKCPSQSDLGIVVELQTSGGPASEYDKHSLITRGWTKVPVFDNSGQLIAGKFRIPFRNVPIKPFLHASHLQNIPQFGDCELYYRVVNMRDAEYQSMLNISAANYQQYRQPNISPPPQAKPVSPYIPPPPTASTIARYHKVPKPTKKRRIFKPVRMIDRVPMLLPYNEAHAIPVLHDPKERTPTPDMDGLSLDEDDDDEDDDEDDDATEEEFEEYIMEIGGSRDKDEDEDPKQKRKEKEKSKSKKKEEETKDKKNKEKERDRKTKEKEKKDKGKKGKSKDEEMEDEGKNKQKGKDKKEKEKSNKKKKGKSKDDDDDEDDDDAMSTSSQEPRLPAIQNGQSLPQDTTIGFQVDRVKKGEYGEGKVRLTAYYASNGKVVHSSTSPVTCSTTSVKSNFKYGYHIFGQQEATFNFVELQGDIVVIGRFYLRKRSQDLDELVMGEQRAEGNLYSEETLVAWAAVPLVLANQSMSIKARRNFDVQTMRINAGTHTLKLFYPPVPEVNSIPFEEAPTHRDWKRYGNATLKIHIFQGQPRPGSLTPSDMSDDGDDVLPEYAWLPCERKSPPKDPYMHGDGFDIYIDSARHLPDSATFTKVAGRVLDRKYEVHGKDINTSVKIDSDIYNPVYAEKFEYRETNIPPSATLLLKIYSIDNFYKQLMVVGYATLNIFVESGTERQPPVDKPGLMVSLNEGAHQLRLYSSGPNGVDPLTESCVRDNSVRVVPCASILVRLTKVPKGPSGRALEQNKVPEADWLRLGLNQPRPKYTDRIYYSYKCMPSKGEGKLFHAMMKRPNVTIREAVAKMSKSKESFYRNDKNVEDFIRNKLTKGDTRPLDVDLTFIAQYSPKQGLKVAVDSAVNLPWTNFTHAHICMNPPGAFYMGPPHATYDKLQFTELLDLRTTNTSPSWKDGFKHFPRRSFHRYLTVIIHLQEVQVSIAKDNYKYGLLEQAWTALQVFTDKYAQTATFQLPLYQGAPNPQMLKQLAREPCREWMERNIRSSSIYLIEGASIFVRLADARRDDELQGDIPGSRVLEVNTDYIPPDLDDVYSRERPGKPLDTMVPQGKTPEQFIDNLALKFKNLVYKLYEEGNMK